MATRSGMAVSVHSKGWKSGIPRQGSNPPTKKGEKITIGT
jgi:hypothetical protein